MKLAQIILPKGHDTYPAHIWLEAELVKRWKGFTAVSATGAWVDETKGDALFEEVIVYQVAMERASVIVLRDVAAELAKRGNQQCVMIVTPNGDVEFVKAVKEKSDGSVCTV